MVVTRETSKQYESRETGRVKERNEEEGNYVTSMT